jgi:hypothetical protein
LAYRFRALLLKAIVLVVPPGHKITKALRIVSFDSGTDEDNEDNEAEDYYADRLEIRNQQVFRH